MADKISKTELETKLAQTKRALEDCRADLDRIKKVNRYLNASLKGDRRTGDPVLLHEYAQAAHLYKAAIERNMEKVRKGIVTFNAARTRLLEAELALLKSGYEFKGERQ